jgi:hypothetical protein
MLIHDMKDLPNVGDYVVMSNAIHGELERLKAVLIVRDNELEDTVHVFFASDEPKDNIYIENGIPYYSIRTYIQL